MSGDRIERLLRAAEAIGDAWDHALRCGDVDRGEVLMERARAVSGVLAEEVCSLVGGLAFSRSGSGTR